MVSLQSLKAEFMYEVIPQRERTLEEIIDLGLHHYIYEEMLWENDEKADPGHNTEVARILNKYPDKWMYGTSTNIPYGMNVVRQIVRGPQKWST
ncbi:hypothetical protein LIER_09318 [Lithospermum erythrorhizon]|uniref:Uncharacterized protein n=1 Tax=Lithospermum erythrorhizon TaxID=34254 RepID=A0AAV3PGG0_LITER